MSPGLLLALICCAPAAEQPGPMRAARETTLAQLDTLDVAVEATPTEIYVGDVVFVNITVTNKGNQPVLLPAEPLPAWYLYVNDHKRQTRFTLGAEFGVDGGIGPHQIMPGERSPYLRGSPSLVNVPGWYWLDAPFWAPETLSEGRYVLSFGLRVGGSGWVGGQGPTLTIRPRPEAEMAKVLELCDSRSPAQRDFPPDWDSARPSLAWFAYPLAPPRASTDENLATLDAILSPGTLRDLVRLTRRAQALYDTEDLEQKRKNLAELLDWLETFPHVQRQCMTDELIVWATNNNEVGFFGFEIAVEAALRTSLVDGDLETRRAWLKNHLHQNPLAAPYLKDFEERFKPVEQRPDHAPTPSDSPPDDAPEDEIEGDSFSG
jgi:hypothetical protein